MLCVSQTGSGKTLTALLPILERLAASHSAATREQQRHATAGVMPEAILMAPTASLVAQHGRTAATLAAALPSAPGVAWLQDDSAAATAPPSTALLLAQPSQVLAGLRLGTLDASKLCAVAIDEVDAVLCNGPHEEELDSTGAAILDLLDASGSDIQYLLTTAFLTRAHERALTRRFPTAARIEQRANRAGAQGTLVPTLRQRFHYLSGCRDTALLKVLRRALAEPQLSDDGGSTLVFANTAAEAERLQVLLVEALPELRPLVLHDGLHAEAKAAAISAFGGGSSSSLPSTGRSSQERSYILVCTADAASRGLDFDTLRHVVCYDMPDDMRTFVHAAGRTARRGRKGLVTCLVRSREEAGRFRNLHALQPAQTLTFSRAGET